MAQTSVAQFATQLRMQAGSLLEQLQKAGVAKKQADDLLSEQDKSRLLEYLRRSHGQGEAKTKITLTRKETSEIRQQDSHGKSHTVQVEVRKKRVLVKRDAAEPRAPLSSGPAFPVAPEGVAGCRRTVDRSQPAARGRRGGRIEARIEAPAAVAIKAQTVPEEEVAAVVAVEAEPVVEAKAQPVAEAKVEAAPPDVKAGAKKVVTRASIIGEEQQRLRAEEERRNAELRALQEAEFKNKQQRSADLARLKQDAEQKAVAAKAAGVAKQVAAQTASDRPAEDKTLHKPAGKPATTDKKAPTRRRRKRKWPTRKASGRTKVPTSVRA
jgi:translation initiation factor IF-2